MIQRRLSQQADGKRFCTARSASCSCAKKGGLALPFLFGALGMRSALGPAGALLVGALFAGVGGLLDARRQAVVDVARSRAKASDDRCDMIPRGWSGAGHMACIVHLAAGCLRRSFYLSSPFTPLIP